MTTEMERSAAEAGPQYTRWMSLKTSVEYMGHIISVLARSGDTGGRFRLMVMVAPKGLGPSRHLHYHDDEGFYLLEGEITFYVGDESYAASPGTFVFLPHGVPHSYTFDSDVVRALVMVAPGGMEAHFVDPRFSKPAESLTPPPSLEAPDMALLEAMTQDLASYGTEVVGPPGPPRPMEYPRLLVSEFLTVHPGN